MSNSQPFLFHLRRDNPYETTVTVRFEVLDGGMGVLGLRLAGREDPAPTLHAEEANVEAADLRAGRFVHVVTGGTRQSYALSRITADVIDAIPEDRWVTLDAVTEYGFRYLVAPDDLETAGEGGAAVDLQPVAQSAVSQKIGEVANLLKTPRPKSVASASASGTDSMPPQAELAPAAEPLPDTAAVAPKQVPVASALAKSALEGLTLEEAREHLLAEMAKVDKLHAHAAALEQRLAASRAREADLLEVLKRWQSR